MPRTSLVAEFFQVDGRHSFAELLGLLSAGCIVKSAAVVQRAGRQLASVAIHLLPFPAPAKVAYLLVTNQVELPRCVAAARQGPDRALQRSN